MDFFDVVEGVIFFFGGRPRPPKPIPCLCICRSPSRNPKLEPEPVPVPAAPAKAVQDRIPEGMECVVCEDRPRKVLFQPCGHLHACVNCAPLLAICPVCRGEIAGRITVNYMA